MSAKLKRYTINAMMLKKVAITRKGWDLNLLLAPRRKAKETVAFAPDLTQVGGSH